MDIGDRIKLLRKNLGLTQQAFADSLNIQRGAVASWEVKRTVPNTPSLTLICREYNVNREWLETGKGDMYETVTDNERIAEYLGRLLRGSVEEDIQLRLISCLSKMSENEWEVLYKLAKEWTNEDKKEEGQA